MPVVGAWARIEAEDHERARDGLDELEGVETFDLGDREKVGMTIEGDDLNAVHGILTARVPAVPGVLCAWPVSVHLEEPGDDEATGDVDSTGTVAMARGRSHP